MSVSTLLRLGKDLYRVAAHRLFNASRRVRLSTQVDRLEVLVVQLEAQQKNMIECSRALLSMRWTALSQRHAGEATGPSAASARVQGPTPDPALRDITVAVTNAWRDELSSNSRNS